MRRRVLITAILSVALIAVVVTLMAQRDFEQVARSVAGSESIHRVTASLFTMDPVVVTQCIAPNKTNPHRECFGHVYVTTLGHEQMISGKGSYPVGTVIVKQKFKSSSTRSLTLHTVMRKRSPGFDSANGDWEYSVVDGAGRKVLAVGRIASCIACHSQYAKTDYVTRKYLMKASN